MPTLRSAFCRQGVDLEVCFHCASLCRRKRKHSRFWVATCHSCVSIPNRKACGTQVNSMKLMKQREVQPLLRYAELSLSKIWAFSPLFLPFVFSKLVINQIIPEDDAIYQCMAENSQGSVLSRARLTVVMSEDRPSAPYNVHAETMSSSAILLAWERPLYNSDKVIAYSVHYMKAEGKRFDLSTL